MNEPDLTSGFASHTRGGEMSEIRAGAVERIADAFIDLNNNGEEEIEEYAESALDALVDYLAEHADVWGGAGNAWAVRQHDGWRSEDIVGYQRGHSDRHARALLAVLREGS